MTYTSTLSNIDKQINKNKESSQTFNIMNWITDHLFFDYFVYIAKISIYTLSMIYYIIFKFSFKLKDDH